MQVLHTIASTRADHGGTSRSVPALCEALGADEASVRLVTTVPADSSPEAAPILPDDTVKCTVVEATDSWRGQVHSSFSFQRALAQEVRRKPPDIIHDHGAWLSSNRAASAVAKRYGVPFIVAPRGMLTGWAFQHHGLKKRAAWHLYQKRVLRRADCFHVTSAEEAEGLRRLGLDQPSAVIPNGVSLPKEYRTKVSCGNQRVALFLSRLHPKKGVPMLLEAWSQAQPKGWRLVLAGPDDGGHRAELRQQVYKFGLEDIVTFPGEISDDEKWSLYQNADIFVLPTHSENFGIVVAEALASGVPVLTTKGAPWRELETHRCGWWTDIGVDPLTRALRKATRCSDEERLVMGQRGRKLVKEHFSWEYVAGQMKKVYAWLLSAHPEEYPTAPIRPT